MSNLIVVLAGGLSGERKISFLTGKACSSALKKKRIQGNKFGCKRIFCGKIKKTKTNYGF